MSITRRHELCPRDQARGPSRVAAWLLGLCTLAATAPSQLPAPVAVEFMTFNVYGPGWNPARRANVAGLILQAAPDVVGLQEAIPQTAGADLLADLQTDYEPHYANTSAPIYLKRSRSFTVLDQGTHTLPACTSGARPLQWVKVETPEGARFLFYNVHLCYADPTGRQLQAIGTAGFMAANAEAGTAHLLAGDLNADDNSPTIAYLTAGQPLTVNSTTYTNPLAFDDTWARAPANHGLQRPPTRVSGSSSVDWILCNPGNQVLTGEVMQVTIPTGQTANYSDHLPVTATLWLPNISAYGCGTNPANSLSVLAGTPALGSTLTFGVDNPLGTQNAGALSLIAIGLSADPNSPCGTLIPNWGMAGSGDAGELLIDTTGVLAFILGASWQGPGIPVAIDLPMPNGNFAGLPLYVQGMIIDTGPTPNVVFGLAAAARVIVMQ